MRGISCSHPRCVEGATFKVAAPWSDEHHHGELKTYGFACPAHLESVFLTAMGRRASCRPGPEDDLGDVEVYRYEPGKKDRHLERLTRPGAPVCEEPSVSVAVGLNLFDNAWR